MQRTQFQPDARYYTVPEALNLFVPNLVWNEVRKTRNQILYGGQGTGKTMLLKRLSWPAMLEKPEFLEASPFVGFYCDMRDLAILKPLFLRSATRGPIERSEALKVASLLASTHLVDCLTKTLIESATTAERHIYSSLEQAVLEMAEQFSVLLGLGNVTDIPSLSFSLARRKEVIISALASPSELQKLLPSIEMDAEPEFLLRVLALAFNRHRREHRLGILLDQYEYLPPDCRAIFNSLLKRESEPHFFSMVACRPFAFSPELADGFIQPGEDFRFTIVEYFEGENESYEDLLSDIWDAIRPQGPRLSRILEGGLKYFASLSSRSVRRFLELCEVAGALEATHTHLINKQSQRRAAESVAKQVRDQFKVASDVSPGSIWHLVLRISERASQNSAGAKSLPAFIDLRSDDLLSFEYISEPGRLLLCKAFEEGALQFHSRRDASSLSIPDRCIVAQILAPVLRAEANERSNAIRITRDEVEQIAKGSPKIGAHGAKGNRAVSSVFLSISFSDLPEPTTARKYFRDIFGESNIRVIEGLGLGGASLDQIRNQLDSTDLTLLDLTYLRPNVIFEMGLTIGMAHRLVPILNQDAREHPNLSPYPFLVDMGYLSYAFNVESIRELRERVLGWADKPVDGAHLLERSTTRGIRLRVKQASNTLAIYYPESREGLWKSFHEGLRKVASSSSTNVHLISSKPFKHDLTSLLDHLVWCVSRSERVIVDTSGTEEPDLYGAFALGFAYGCSGKGRSKEILRLEESNLRYTGLSMWPSALYKRWKNTDQLFSIIEEFLPRRRRRGR